MASQEAQSSKSPALYFLGDLPKVVQNLHFVALLPVLTVEFHIEQQNPVRIARNFLRVFFTHSLANEHTIGFLVQLLVRDCTVLGV